MALDFPFRTRIKPIPGETPRKILRRGFYLPAIIGTMGWSIDFLHSEYDTIGKGQFSQPAMGGRGSRELLTLDDIDSVTIVWAPRWLPDAEGEWGSIRRLLERIGNAKVPFELMIKPKGLRNNVAVRDTLVFQETVTLRSLHVQTNEGEPDAEYYTLSLKEWRHAGEGRRGAGKPVDGGGHTLTDADTLNSLAMRFFHSYGTATAIARANGIKGWGKDTPLKRMKRFKRRGAKVKIPSIPRTRPDVLPPPKGANARLPK